MKRRVMMGKKKLRLFTKRFFPAGTYTWVVPKGCTEVDVFLVGAGGGSGGANTTWGPYGGGGGGYTKSYRGKGYVKPSSGTWMGTYDNGRDGDAIPVTEGKSIQIIVGAGVPNGTGGYSQFMNSDYRAEGGKPSTNYTNGGDGGSAGGQWWSNSKDQISLSGASDGHDNSGGLGKGQGHTTRDFGEPTGKRNAGGGGATSLYVRPHGGESDYTEGSGEWDDGPSSNNGMGALEGGGGYGGGASVSSRNHEAIQNLPKLKGGDGTVLIRYYAYEE